MKRIKTLILSLLNLRTFLRMEFNRKQAPKVGHKVNNLKSGFLSISSVFYDFSNNDMQDYLSDWTRLRKASKINDRRRIIIDDKLLFHHKNEDNKHVKPIVAITKDRKLFKIENSKLIELKGEESFGQYVNCFANGLIVKPYTGGGGARISKVKFHQNKLHFEGACTSYSDFERTVINNDKANFLMTEIIKQTGPLAEVYPNTLNTIRILTMFDHHTNKPFIARAVQRIGTKKSVVVDNFTAGGISALIDIESGILGKGAHYPNGDKLIWYSSHPDTDVGFEGLRIDNWEEIKNYVLNLSQQYFYIPYIGWDIVPMEDDFMILEANSNSDVNLLQIHGGLLKDERIKEFYKYHHVIN